MKQVENPPLYDEDTDDQRDLEHTARGAHRRQHAARLILSGNGRRRVDRG